MFSRTDAAKQVDVEFRPGIVAQAANPIRALSGAISGLIKTYPVIQFQPVIALLPTYGNLPSPALESSIAIRPAT